MFFTKLNEECSANYLVTLYFYSNEESCTDCETQGYLLTYLRDKYSFVKTYSFDVELDSPVIDSLKLIYNVTTVPSIVFDGELYSGFLSKEELENIAVEHQKVTYVKK